MDPLRAAEVRGAQKDPEVVCGPSGVLEAWGTKTEKPHLFKRREVCWPCRRRRQGQKITGLWTGMVVLALGPQPPPPHHHPPPKKKNENVANKTLRDPFKVCKCKVAAPHVGPEISQLVALLRPY